MTKELIIQDLLLRLKALELTKMTEDFTEEQKERLLSRLLELKSTLESTGNTL